MKSMNLMTYLSKNIFKLHISEKKVPIVSIRTYNSQIYDNPYIYTGKLSTFPGKYFYSPLRGKDLQMTSNIIEKCPSMTIGHASIVKAELFGDPDKFMSLTLQYLIKLYENGPKVINNNLIKQVLETFNTPNNSRYYLERKIKVHQFLAVNKGAYSFLTYI